jgi:hypothetical protein
MTVDNAKYFDSAMFKDLCHQVNVDISYAAPQAHGIVNVALH